MNFTIRRKCVIVAIKQIKKLYGPIINIPNFSSRSSLGERQMNA